MNNYNSNSSTNLNPKITNVLLWLTSIAVCIGITRTNGYTTVIIIVATLLLLLYEKKNLLIRNHASQVLVLNLTALVLSILFSSIINILIALVSWIPILNIVTSATLSLVLMAFSVLIFAINVLGLLKAIAQEPISLPIISRWGETIDETLRK